MKNSLSPRLAEIVDALPLHNGIRVLEIGCGTGAAVREIAKRIGNGHILAIDRSSKAVQQATANSAKEIQTGNVVFKQIAAEKFELPKTEKLFFDIAFAIRVGALDGRHPEIEKQALTNIAKALKKKWEIIY